MERTLAVVVGAIVATLALSNALAVTGPSAAPGERYLSMVEMVDRYGALYPIEPQPEGLDAVEAAHHGYAVREVQGRTAQAWVAHAHELSALPLEGGGPEGARSLVNEVVRLYGHVGLPAGPSVVATLDAQAAALDPVVRDAFAGLVGAVADAYGPQAALAAELGDRWASFTPGETFVTIEEREAMDARARSILKALGAFRAASEGLVGPSVTAASDTPLFTDPEGLVILGGLGDSTYTQSGLLPDPILLVDPMGNDVYQNSAGGADPLGVLTTGVAGGGNRLAVSVVADLDGNDLYTYAGPVTTAQGAGGVGGLGLLVDMAGSDTYEAYIHRTVGPFGPLGLTYFDGGAQGYGFAGYGLLLDAAGDDLYRYDFQSPNDRALWAFAQGFGAAGGLGIASDLGGADQWLSDGYNFEGGFDFIGSYTMGVGFWGGVGILTDTGLANDVYHSTLTGRTTDYYGQAFGAFGGAGILYEDGGDDDYSAVEIASNPWIDPLLNCAFGTASAGGVGVMVDVAGDDSYFGDTVSPRRAATMNEGFGGIGAAYGLLIDGEGDDDHVMRASGAPGTFVAGRGHVLTNGNIVGNYLDAGGSDTYEGPGTDGAVWLAGADVNAVPGGVL